MGEISNRLLRAKIDRAPPLPQSRGLVRPIRRGDGRLPPDLRADLAARRPPVPDRTARGRDARRRADAPARRALAPRGGPRHQPRCDPPPDRDDGPRLGTRGLRVLRSRLVPDRGAGEEPALLPDVAHDRDGDPFRPRAERRDRAPRDPRRHPERAVAESQPRSLLGRRGHRANVGSVATEVGNPQNAFIAIRSGIPFLTFTAYLLPVTDVCLAIANAGVRVAFRRD